MSSSPRGLSHLWRRSLRARLVGYFLVLSVITVVVVGATVYLRATADLERAVLDRVAAAADLKADAVTRWIDEQRRNVVFAAGLLRDGSDDPGEDTIRVLLTGEGEASAQEAARQEVVGTLGSIVRQTADAQELVVIDPAGVIRGSTFAAHEGESQADEAFFVRGSSATWVQPVFTSRLTGQPTVAVATPVFAGNGQRVGVLVAFLDLQRLDRILLDRAGMGATGQTYLVAEDGRMVHSGSVDDRLSSPGIAAGLAGTEGAGLYADHREIPVAGAYRWLPEIGAALLAEMTQDEAFATAREMAVLTGLIGLASVFLLAAGISIITRSVTQPILALAATAKRVADGDLEATAPVISQDEVGTLTAAFNQMTARLSENVETLERRVEERTVELRERNSELAIVNEIGQALAAKLEFARVIETVGERVASALDVQGLSIAIRDEATDQITFLYWIDSGQRRRDMEGTTLDDEVSKRIVATGTPIRFTSADDAAARGMPYRVSGTESYVGVPIPVGDRTIGVMALGTHVRDAYTADDERLLVTVATNMGVAIDNARLFAELNSALEAKTGAEARYRRLVEEMPLALYIDHPDERAASEYVSPMIVPMFGYPVEEWKSDTFFPSILHPDDRERVLQDHADVFERGDDRWSWDFRVIAADGRTVWVHDEAVVVRDDAGAALYVQGFMQDVTDERTAAAEVRRQKQYFEALVDASPVAIVVMDRGELVTAWNPAAERLFGYDAVEAVGRHIDDLIFPEERRTEGAITTTEARETGRAQRIGQRMRKDGRMVDVEIVAVPLRLDGEHVGYYAIYHDITELELARKAAEDANHAKSAFLAAMSHEIRTPMNAIIGMSGLLVDSELDAEQRDYAETIRASGDALLTIINDILDFSKIEAGKVELEAAPFSPQAVVEGALDVLAPTAAAKNIELVYAPSGDLPSALLGDAGRLRQILLNLLSNAVKFTERGEVVLAVEGRPLDDGRWEVAVEVRDTGIGIAPDHLGDLFQSFSQLDASISRRYGGTGLGLAISRRLAELMDGSLRATSSGVPGEGSTFRLAIRAPVAPHAVVERREVAEAGQLAGRRVLIVDDNATNRRILVAQTTRWGMGARETGDADEALAWVRAGERFDVALLDFHMPEIEGPALAAALREEADGGGPPVVILSSVGSHRITEPSVFASLTKPVKPSALYDALATALAGPGDPPARDDGVPSADRRQRAAAARAEGGATIRILLAEDNSVNRKLALKLLERMGHTADVATNGQEAVEAVEQRAYDVILMDVQMPELDGLEATRRIRAGSPSGGQPRIVAMTANAMAGDREACLAAGMDDYVSKPIRPPELAAALAKVEVPSRG